MKQRQMIESETREFKTSLAELKEGMGSIEQLRKGYISRRRNPLVADLLRRVH